MEVHRDNKKGLEFRKSKRGIYKQTCMHMRIIKYEGQGNWEENFGRDRLVSL